MAPAPFLRRATNHLHEYHRRSWKCGWWFGCQTDTLGQTENTIATAVRRMREEFRTLLRLEITDTLTTGEDIDEELRYLLRLVW